MIAPAPLRLGLTGGMGCGKSTAGRYFAAMGWARLDTDEVIRQEVLPDPAIAGEAARLFGQGVLTPAGGIDRAALAARVFTSETALRDWEAVVHPRLYALWQTKVKESPGRPWVIEVPLLYEKGLEKWVDFVACVATSSERQYARLAERGMSQALAVQRISKQLPLVQKIQLAQFVLSNDGSPDFLRDQVALLSGRLLAGR